MPRYVRVLDTAVGTPRVADTLAQWVDVDDLIEVDGVKRYVALLTQSGTDAPVATVLENSLGGTLVWTYSNSGYYQATLAGAFPNANKIIAPAFPIADASGFVGGMGVIQWNDANSIFLVTNAGVTHLENDPVNFTISSDNLLTATVIDIRVYP